MKRIFFILTVLLLSICSNPDMAQAKITVGARTAVLVDGYTGQILWEKDAHRLRSPASTQKMLTALIILEQADLKEQVKAGKRAHETYVGQTIGLREGDVLTIEDLLQAILLWSANDAAVALAEHLGGPGLFSLIMNEKAWALGAYRSHFVNPNGYSVPGQFSTAYDLALIARAAMQEPFFANTVQKKEAEINWLNKEKVLKVVNTNKLLEWYPGVTGIKTGTTSAAGGCLAASAVRDRRWLIAVVLGSSRRYGDAAALLDYGFSDFTQTAIEKGKVFDTVPVRNGIPSRVGLIPEKSVFLTIPRGDNSLVDIKTELVSGFQAPVKKGERLGRVQVYYQNRLVGETFLLAEKDVKKAGIFSGR